MSAHDHGHSHDQDHDQDHDQGQNLPFDNKLMLEHPLNSPHAVKEAWRFISNHHNADRYPIFHVEQFKQMVQDAAREYGIELDREH